MERAKKIGCLSTERQRGRGRDRDREKQRHRETETDTHTHRDRDRETQRDREFIGGFRIYNRMKVWFRCDQIGTLKLL